MSAAVSLASDRATPSARGTAPTALLDGLAVASIAVCALVLHRDGLFGGPAFYELDTRLFYYPLAEWVGRYLQHGVFPLWLPDIFTGYPIFADGELGLAYLPQVALFYLLPAPLAFVWLRALHAFLAGLFTYLYLRTLRLEPVPSLGGALVFAFGSFLSAQMHHENVVRSAVWLPAVLCCAERSVFRVPRSAFMWSGIGALAFAQSALGLHVQPVLMTALALGAYAVFRAFVPTRNAERGTRNAYAPLLTGAAITAGGLVLAAVQWLPLGEWALVSSRRGGVSYEFASAFALAPVNLPSVIFPFFFRLSDATTWWTLWQQWETELYVGIPTLALMIIGIVFSRRTELLYFVPLGAIALLIAMATYAPLVNLHEFLWSIPGFSFLRAPGRFTYLVVFASACLAAFGLQALRQRRLRITLGLLGAVPSVAALAALLALLPTWRNWLLDDPTRARGFVESTYLSVRAQYPIDVDLIIQGLASSLDFGAPKTAWSLIQLGLTSACFVVWLALHHQRALLAQSLFVGLIAADLLVFAYDFHPRATLDSMAPSLPAGISTGSRIFLNDPIEQPDIEPNQLLTRGLQTVQGYSSLPSQRHVELDSASSTQPDLLKLWSAQMVVEPNRPSDLHEVDGVRFRAEHRLASVSEASAPARFVVPGSVGSVSSIRLIGTLSYAFQARQGATVATITLDGSTVIPLRAGVDLAERALDRPSLSGLVRHQRAHVALDFDEATPEGEAYVGHLYEANLQLPRVAALQSVALGATDPNVIVEVEGIALIDANGVAHSLDLSNRDGFRRVGPRVIQVTYALPRAYVLPRAQAFSPARHPALTPTQIVANPDVDLGSMVLIEGDPSVPDVPSQDGRPANAAMIQDAGPNVVRITATADAPSYLILNDFYQRGWNARVDGQSTRVLIANALFRAVPIEPGTHEVEFRFEPLSLLIGAAISGLSLLAALPVIAWGLRRG